MLQKLTSAGGVGAAIPAIFDVLDRKTFSLSEWQALCNRPERV